MVCDAPSAVFPARIGLPLELVPTGDITKLKAGDELELKVYLNGKPYTGQGAWDATYNGFSTEAEDKYYSVTKVSGDTVRILVPQPGRWFVRYYITIDATGKDAEQYNQTMHTSTLVFQIPNAPKTSRSGAH